MPRKYEGKPLAWSLLYVEAVIERISQHVYFTSHNRSSFPWTC